MTAAALDACLCLLLVSAAAVTVTTVPEPPAVDGDRADSVAETLTATTADVPYTLRPPPGSESTPEANPEYERVAHGSLTSLLADVAVRTVRVDGRPLTGTNEGFAARVRAAVSERLPSRTRVVVQWRPYPGSHLGREFAVGPAPPANADVNAETVRAPSGVDAPDSVDAVASDDGFSGLARAVADSLVAGILPPEKGRLALGDDAPVDALVRNRYRRVSARYAVDTTDAVDRGDTREANRRIAAAMAGRVEADLRNSTGSPEAAAASLELGSVDISVRTWWP